MGLVNKTVGVYKRYGLKGFCTKLGEKLTSPMRAYTKNVSSFLPTEQELKEQRAHTFLVEPRISIVVPAYETNETFLRELLDSLEKQSYDNWELCIADGSRSEQVEKIIREYQNRYEKENSRFLIRYKRLLKNNGISENTNAGLTLATGAYIGFMDHDDVLAHNALFEVTKLINERPDVDVIYSDEDKVSCDLKRHTQPHFKTDFNLELLRDNNYICHFLVISRPLLDKVEGFRKEFDGSQDYDFILRCTEAAKQVGHIPKILYHWRMHAASTAGDSDSKDYTFDAGARALTEHLKRLCIPATVEKRIEVGCFHVIYHPKEQFCEEDYILLLPEGVEPLDENWKEELYSYCSQPRVGIVGGKTFTKSGRVRQCGYIAAADGSVRASFGGLRADYKGYCRRAVLAQEMSGVSFSFAMIKKSAYEAVGGFCMELPHPYREVEFSLRLKKAGFVTIFDPYARAVVEKEPDFGVSCGEDEAKAFLRDRLRQEKIACDPFYSPNFSQNGQTFTID